MKGAIARTTVRSTRKSMSSAVRVSSSPRPAAPLSRFRLKQVYQFVKLSIACNSLGTTVYSRFFRIFCSINVVVSHNSLRVSIGSYVQVAACRTQRIPCWQPRQSLVPFWKERVGLQRNGDCSTEGGKSRATPFTPASLKRSGFPLTTGDMMR